MWRKKKAAENDSKRANGRQFDTQNDLFSASSLTLMIFIQNTFIEFDLKRLSVFLAAIKQDWFYFEIYLLWLEMDRGEYSAKY